MKIKDLKKGSYFTKRAIEDPKGSQVWVRGDYDRSMKRYEAINFDDVSRCCYIKGETEVFTDFTF